MQASHYSRFFPPFLTTLLAAIFTLVFAGSSYADQKPQVHAFEKDILAFEASDQKNPPPKGAILLAGDSQFTRWKSVQQDLPDYTIINRGFGGSKMSDLLYYTDRIVIPYQPRLIVVNEGGNDLNSGRTPEEVVADHKTFVEKVRKALPDVPIIIGGQTPSTARWAQTDKKKHLNDLLKAFIATQKNIQYIDLFDQYLGPDGKPNEELFAPDHLHHSAAGYKVRMKFLVPLLGKPDKAK